MRARLSRGKADVAVRLGETQVYVAAGNHRIYYRTLYGVMVDRHFDWDVRNAAVLDIGAHKGYFAARTLAEGTLRADSYEPASQNFAYLALAAADHPDWRVHPFAVGAEAGMIELHLSPDSWSHSIHKPMGKPSVGTEQVAMISLSETLHAISTAGVPVVAKINVEGAAGAMILGTDAHDWDAVVSLWVDVEPNDPVGPDALTEHLAGCGLHHARVDGRRLLFAR